jgi:hypothetical protein
MQIFSNKISIFLVFCLTIFEYLKKTSFICALSISVLKVGRCVDSHELRNVFSLYHYPLSIFVYFTAQMTHLKLPNHFFTSSKLLLFHPFQ